MNIKSSGYKKKELWFTIIGSVLAAGIVIYLIWLIVAIRAKARMVFENTPNVAPTNENFDFNKYQAVLKKIEAGKQVDESQ